MLKIGVMTSLAPNVREEIQQVRDFGLASTQMACWDKNMYTQDNASTITRACRDFEVAISTLWTGYPGTMVWNFIDGPSTIGLVPPGSREMRTAALIAGAEFAGRLGLESITTHAGFIPENPKDPLYPGTIEALTRIASRCKELGLYFCFETGQETPITLRRAMADIGTDNLAVNLDPANLLMYGKANPIDALDILGPFVRGVHAKDGDYPSQPGELGPEKALGEGRVDYPRFVARLKSFGYDHPLTIEREISGEQQIVDIRRAISILEPLC